MVKLKYVGTGHFREITATDFRSIGAGDNKTVWDRDNLRHRKDANVVNEVSQEAADWLIENELGDWETVTDEADVPQAAINSPGEAQINEVVGQDVPRPGRKIRDNPQA